jgi:cytochrome c-type biogenesis protein CcmH
MILWPILAVMTLAAVFAVWWPLARRQKSVRSGSDVAVYRDQLTEIDRDEAASRIGSVEAEAARVEVSRRLIAAAQTAEAAKLVIAPAPAGTYRWATIAAAIVLLPLGAGITYLSLGSPNLVPVSMNAEAIGQQLPEGVEQTVAEVENYLESNPKNGRGWELLAPVYLRLGRFDDAVRARRNALEIFGPDAARLGDLGEAIIMASGGVVTPEAKDLFTRAEAADPEDVMAQYYLGLSAKQEGRRDEAVKRWTALVSTAREGAEWLPLVKNALARIDDKGPSVAVVAPSASAAPPEHNGSIEAMVERLAERLKKNGSDVPGWIQLVRSYRVLGKADKVKAAIADAHAALASDQEASQRLELGLQGLDAEAAAGASGPDVAGPAGSPPTVGAIAPPGPSASQVAASAQMAPVERNSMIEGMVARLADRLKKDGSDVPGWIQLVRSYRVLGNADKANAAIADARTALANDRDGLQRLEQGLQSLQAEAATGAPAPAPPTTAVSIPQPGPNANQVASAAQMAPAERNSMIEGMVARLAQRMAENGSDVDGWLRLIKAYSVLGERDKALAAVTNARNAFAGNSDNLRRIGELTKELGLEGS